MTTLTLSEKQEFLRKHFRHRLTLLRTLRERKKLGYNYQGQGDIYRCVKDSNLIAVRLWLDFLGLKGEYNRGAYRLVKNRRRAARRATDDVIIEQFIGRGLEVREVPVPQQRILAGVYKRADKELAHLTRMFNNEFNEEDVLIEAATAVEDLLRRLLYEPSREQLPEMDA
jgi:hypothetical protein